MSLRSRASLLRNWKLRRWLPTTLAVGLGLGGPVTWVLAQPPVAPAPSVPGAKADDKKTDTKKPEDPKKDPLAAERTISVSFDGAQWQEVLDWYAKESGLILNTSVKPTGSVTIKPPGMARKFTLGEVTDLLNEAMVLQKFVLIRYNTTFTIWPVDEKIDWTLMPAITQQELPKHGKTELVRCVIGPFKTVSVADIRPEIEAMLTPFGKLQLLERSNSFQLSDKAGNISRIKQVLDDMEATSDGGHLRHECKFKKAREGASLLKNLLKDSTTTVDTPMVQPYQPYFGQPGFGQPTFGQPGFGGSGFERRDRDSRFGSGGSSGGAAQPRGAKTVQIEVDDDKNALIVTAPEDKIVLARKILEEWDVPSVPGERPIVITPPALKTYAVQNGTADATAKLIMERYPSIRVTAIPPSQLMVFGGADDHAKVAGILNNGEPGGAGGTVSKILNVSSDPKELAAILSKAFPSSTAGGPMIEPQSGAIFFRGTSAQLLEAESIIKAYEGPTSNVIGGNRLQYSFDGGNAGILAEALRNSMNKMGKNPVLIDNLTGDPTRPTPLRSTPPGGTPLPRPGSGLPPMPPPSAFPGEKQSSLPPGPRDPRFVLAQLVDPEAKKELKPVIIQVVGNKLLIQSEDPAALQLINELIRFYVQQGSKADENLFEVLKLKYVSAEDAAKVVTEVFNGPQQSQQNRGGGGGGGFNPINLIGGLLGGGAPSGPPAPGRVRVVAEKSSNSLVIVKASQLDLLTMKNLLKNVIDSGETDSDAIQRTYVIRLKNTDAADMATQLEKLYRPLLSASGGGQAQALPFPFAQPQQGGSSAKPPALTISTDDRTNSVLIVSTKTLYEEVRDVVEMLDTAVAAENTEVVRVVPIRGIDPTLVQQMVDAMQGRDPNAANNRGIAGGGLGGNRTGQGGLGQGGLGQGFGGLGGGFPGLGGGAFGGGLGGGNRGGGLGGGNLGGGGGGNRGGGGGNRGGGGGTRGGGGRQANLGGQGGPSNFDYRDMDVPSALTNALYDPENDRSEPAPAIHTSTPRRKIGEILQAGWQQPSPMPGIPAPGAQPGAGQPNTAVRPVDGQPGVGVSAPTGTVTAIPLSEAGVVVVRATNQRDMEIVLELMEFIRKQAEGTEPELRLVPLKYQDCNVVAGTLNSIFARVQVGIGSNTVPASARQVNAGNILTGLAGAPSSTQNVYCVAMPRFNALLIAGPKGRFADIIKEVEKQDTLNDPSVAVKAIQLKKASAQVIALQLRQLYSQRFPSEGPPNHQFRINFDLPSNSILVTAAPADMKDIEELIKQLDTMTSQALNDLRIFALKNAFADELASVLIQALTSNVLNPLQQAQQQWYTQSVTQGGIGGQGGIQALLGQQGQQQQGLQQGLQGLQGLQLQQGGLGQQNQLGTGGVNLAPTIAQVGSSTGGGLATKSSALRFFSSKDGQVVETGFLEDVHIIPNQRTNALLVAAKPETMKLIEKLIDNLDTVAAARSYINIFQMKNADAALTALLIQQLFSGSNRTTLTPGGAAGGQGLNQGANAQNAAVRPLLTVFGEVSPGASLIDLRISIDDRTNSLIVAGSLNDLETIRSIIQRLELSDSAQRHFDVYKLRNAAAADVATALQTFMTNSLNVYQGAQFLSAYAQLQKNVVIVAEPVSNTIMVSATPQYFAELKRIIERIDAQPPQVVIQVMIAEVQLTNNEEVGVEYGVQSPVLFNRGGSLNFNSTAALPSSNVSPGIVAYQGLGNLGVGRASTLGPGGFVFSAQSDSFSLLVRALKAQGRIDILSRPHLHVTDNQTGYINVGQSYPTPTNTTITNGLAQTGVEYVPIGIILRVTPRINPDGKVLMRVEPQVSNVAPSTVSVGNGINAPIFNQETVETTVLAGDGETIIIGGLINKQDSRTENGIPFFKDIPYVGSLFRYRTQATSRREILFIMTPQIVRSEYDTARILAEESRKMNWCLPDIAAIHGHGMEVMGPASKGANPIPVGGTMPGQIPVGQLPGGFGPGFVPSPILPGPGGDGGLEFGPIGSAAPSAPIPAAPPAITIPAGAAQPGVRPGQFLPPAPPSAGIPILMPNGTLSQSNAVVYPGTTLYVMQAGGPPIVAMPSTPAVAGGPPPRNNGVFMAYPPAQDVPAGESKAPRGKEVRPWGVFNK